MTKATAKPIPTMNITRTTNTKTVHGT